MSTERYAMPTTSDGTIIVHPGIEALRATIDEIGLDVATSFTLADSIREGAGVTKQFKGGFVDEETSCALGAGWLSAKARGYI